MAVLSLLLSAAGIVGHIWCLVEAYGDDATQGTLCMCVPFYSLLYAVTRIEGGKKWAIVALELCAVAGGLLRFYAI